MQKLSYWQEMSAVVSFLWFRFWTSPALNILQNFFFFFKNMPCGDKKK